jgi:hypothetical protein
MPFHLDDNPSPDAAPVAVCEGSSDHVGSHPALLDAPQPDESGYMGRLRRLAGRKQKTIALCACECGSVAESDGPDVVRCKGVGGGGCETVWVSERRVLSRACRADQSRLQYH